MVRSPSIDKNGQKKGAWSPEEDNKLRAYVERYGHWNWRQLPKFAGLNRCGKSCRLRWMNYLKPDVRRGNYSPKEQELILKLHQEHGNKWSVIAAQLPGRTDNDIKNYWHTHLRRRRMNQDSNSTDDHHQQSSERSQNNMDDSDHNEEYSSSMSTINDPMQRVLDQDGSYYYNIAAAAVAMDHSYSETSSLNYEYSTLRDCGNSMSSAENCDNNAPPAVATGNSYNEESSFNYEYSTLCDAGNSISSVEPVMEPFDYGSSFWDQPFATDTSDTYNLHQQFPAAAEEEILTHPFGPYLDEINIDCWLNELMQ